MNVVTYALCSETYSSGRRGGAEVDALGLGDNPRGIGVGVEYDALPLGHDPTLIAFARSTEAKACRMCHILSS